MTDYHRKDSASTSLKIRPIPLKKAALYSVALIIGALIIGSYAKAMEQNEEEQNSQTPTHTPPVVQTHVVAEMKNDTAGIHFGQVLCQYTLPGTPTLVPTPFVMSELAQATESEIITPPAPVMTKRYDTEESELLCGYPATQPTPPVAETFLMPEPTKVSLPPVQFAQIPQAQTPLRPTATDESSETEGS